MSRRPAELDDKERRPVKCGWSTSNETLSGTTYYLRDVASSIMAANTPQLTVESRWQAFRRWLRYMLP